MKASKSDYNGILGNFTVFQTLSCHAQSSCYSVMIQHFLNPSFPQHLMSDCWRCMTVWMNWMLPKP